MPVRIVPKNYRNLTGLIPNSRTQSMTAFESSLERDFLLLLDFDPDVEWYDPIFARNSGVSIFENLA